MPKANTLLHTYWPYTYIYKASSHKIHLEKNKASSPSSANTSTPSSPTNPPSATPQPPSCNPFSKTASSTSSCAPLLVQHRFSPQRNTSTSCSRQYPNLKSSIRSFTRGLSSRWIGVMILTWPLLCLISPSTPRQKASSLPESTQ